VYSPGATPSGSRPRSKHSAEASPRRLGSPLQSAMSMLNFYINRAGENLPAKQKRILKQAKVELRKSFAKERAKALSS
jgi:hypothetical protein